MKPGPEGDVLVLNFAAMNVPLEEELRRRVSPFGAAVVERVESQRRGRSTRQRRSSNRLARSADPRLGAAVRDTVSIEPRYFPYRLEKVRGVFDYENGRVVLDQLAAEHGPNTRVTGRGFCEVDASGGWRLHLDHLDCGRLTTDRDLMQALPPRLKKAITEMHLSGPMSMRGRFDLSSSGRPQEPLRGMGPDDRSAPGAHGVQPAPGKHQRPAVAGRGVRRTRISLARRIDTRFDDLSRFPIHRGPRPAVDRRSEIALGRRRATAARRAAAHRDRALLRRRGTDRRLGLVRRNHATTSMPLSCRRDWRGWPKR